MISSRVADPIEKMFIGMNSSTQLVIELEDSQYVPEYVDKLLKCVLGFRLSTDGSSIFLNKGVKEIYRIPESISSNQKIAEYLFLNHTPSPDKCLASIGTNRNKICLSVNHLCADGAFMKELVENLPLPNQIEVPNMIPKSCYQTFSEEIKKYKPDCGEEPILSRLIPKKKPDCSAKIVRTAFYKSKVNELSCYSKGKVTRLTDMLWATSSLAIAAMNGNISTVGALTVLNMRPYVKQPFNPFSICNHYSIVITSSNVRLDQHVSDLARNMREDFTRKKMNGEQFAYLASLNQPQSQENELIPSPPGLVMELSNAGAIRVKRPIKDIFIATAMPSCQMGGSSLLSYSTMCDNPENDIINTGFLFSDQDLNSFEAERFAASIDYGLKHVRMNDKICDAIKILSDFQNR